MSGRNEDKPVLKKMNTKERGEIEDMQDIGGPGNPNFAPALQLSIRCSVIMCLLAAIVWVPAIRKPFPNQVQARIPLVICLFVFTINPLLGIAIQNACCGILGTFWACLHMWVMNGIFPGGMKPEYSSTSACAIFGWVNMLVFMFLVLWSKCGIGTKMFALATDIGFMLAFLDPASTMPFSENFQISHRGTAVNVMIATILGCLAAPLMNLIPYPMSFAYNNMKGNAIKASADTARLFEAIIEYYAGDEASVVVESEVKHALDLRAELDGMAGAIGAAWWEGFDLGTRGTVRALMESHLSLLNEVYDRLRSALTVARTEDFGPSHTVIMRRIHDSSMRVALSVKELLNSVTAAATDGDISSSEKAELQSLVEEAKAAVKQLAKDFDVGRKSLNKPVSAELLGENFFVLTISAYARLVINYCDMMCTSPPKGQGFGAALMSGLKSTWDMKAMTERFNMNFTIVHFTALLISWLFSVMMDNWGGGCVITAVFLMSPAVCPDIQAFLNVLNAVVLAVIVGTLVFQWTCDTGMGDYILPFTAFVLWIIGMFGVFSKSAFLLPCLVFVALTPFRWVTSCPTGDIAAGARAIWAGMVANILAIGFVCTCQYTMGADRANHLAINALDDAFLGIRNAFHAFWDEKDVTGPMGPVAGALGSGCGFAGAAKIEPRFSRLPWKMALYNDMANHVRQIRLDILMLWFAMAGSDGQPDAIFQKFNTSQKFMDVRDDLNGTLEDTHALCVSMVAHEKGRFTGLEKLNTVTGIDELDALPGLIAELNGKLRFPRDAPESMEDDEICQVSTVCFLLDSTVKHIAALMKCGVRQA